MCFAYYLHGCELPAVHSTCRFHKKKKENRGKWGKNQTAAAAEQNKEVEKAFSFLFSVWRQNFKNKNGKR